MIRLCNKSWCIERPDVSDVALTYTPMLVRSLALSYSYAIEALSVDRVAVNQHGLNPYLNRAQALSQLETRKHLQLFEKAIVRIFRNVSQR